MTKKYTNPKMPPMQTKMKSLYLVPVDFSLASYKAAQYAMLLAQSSAGRVKLVHFAHLQEIQHVENPLVWLNRSQRVCIAALERLGSLSEMMELQGVEVTYDVLEGNLAAEFDRCIKKIQPAVVVVGKGVRGYGSMTAIATKRKIAAILVPQQAQIKLPESVVMAVHAGPLLSDTFQPVWEILRNASKSISILQLGQTDRNASWILDLNTSAGVKPDVVNLDSDNTILGTLAFIRSCNADLVCVVKRNSSFFQRLFSNNDPAQLANNLDVPVYLVSGD